jgi:anti-sigma regulatory factor (Ser/Thr protein kinase)
MRTVSSSQLEQDTQTKTEPELRLVLPNRAENVALVRRALSGVVEVLELGEARLLDINAAVSEACNNVVVHAYGGGEGPMDVYLCIQPTELEVIVGDRGVGIRPNVPEPELEVQGLGLSLIHALTDRVEFHGGMDEGTRVRMSFAFEDGTDQLSDDGGGEIPEAPPPPGELSITVSSGPLAAPVLGRVIAMLAARAEFSLEGISEAELVTDAVAAHAPRAIVGDRLQLGIDRPNGQLVVRVGPLEEGGAARVVQASALGDLPPVLERLTEDHRVESSGDQELLCLVLGAR